MKTIRKPTYKIINEVVNSMNSVIHGKTGAEWITVDSVHTISVCSFKWAMVGWSVKIGGNTYLITGIDLELSTITVTGTPTPTETEIDLGKPKFWYGTIVETSGELNSIPNEFDKFPMIFLHSPTNELHNFKEDENIGMTSEVSLYFMTCTDPTQWLTADHYSKAVDPMRSMAIEFMNTLRKTKGVNKSRLYQANIEDWAKWGKSTLTGQSRELITGNLSGVSLKEQFEFEKQIVCCEC